MTQTKFRILLAIELISIILFNALDYLSISSDTFNASGLKVMFWGLIFFLGLILLVYITKTRFSQYLSNFNQTDTNIYNLIMTELDSEEISEATKKNISNDLILFLHNRSKNEKDFQYSKFFRNCDYTFSEERPFQILSHQIISKYKEKEKLIGLLNFMSIIFLFPVIFAYILNRFSFSASIFNITANLKGSLYIIFVVLVLIPLEKWTHFEHRKLLSFILNIIFVILFSKISSFHFSNSSVDDFMNIQIKIMPNIYFLIGYISTICLTYATQCIIRRNIIKDIFYGNMLERTI